MDLNQKNFQSVTDKVAPKSFEEIESNMWKNNVKTGPRKKADFLDTSKEDFAQNKS